MKLRFAARPDAHLDVAEARWALLAWRLARDHGGTFVLRLEDGEPSRARHAHADAVEHDLGWLGLSWDETTRQSARSDRYVQAADTLRRNGRLYPCFESEEELRAKRDRRLRRGGSAAYDRAMLSLTAAQRAAAEASGRRPYWRFRLSDGACRWRDLAWGPREVTLEGHSDPVLERADGMALSLLRTTVDDRDEGITHVLGDVRDEAASAMRMDISTALGGAPSRVAWAHLPTLIADGPPTLRRLRADGIEPAAIARVLAGHDPAGTVRESIARVGASPARFDVAALQAANHDVLRDMPFADVAARLPPGATEAFWSAVRDHVDLLAEARLWWEVVHAEFIVSDSSTRDPASLRKALRTVPDAPWTRATWSEWRRGLVATHGDVAGIESALRLAVTGEEQGPPLELLLPLIGVDRVRARLRDAIR